MITKVHSHIEFLNFVTKEIELLYPNKKIIREHFTDLVTWTSLMDLTLTADLLKHRYSSNSKGRKPRNPCDMLKNLLLMHKLHYTSVDKWVIVLRTIPLYAILSGFDPNSTPGVGTLYDFFNRLWLAPSPHLMNKHKRKPKKPKKKGKRNQKIPPKNPNVVESIVRCALKKRKHYYAPKAHDGLQRLFHSIDVCRTIYLSRPSR